MQQLVDVLLFLLITDVTQFNHQLKNSLVLLVSKGEMMLTPSQPQLSRSLSEQTSHSESTHTDTIEQEYTEDEEYAFEQHLYYQQAQQQHQQQPHYNQTQQPHYHQTQQQHQQQPIYYHQTQQQQQSPFYQFQPLSNGVSSQSEYFYMRFRQQKSRCIHYQELSVRLQGEIHNLRNDLNKLQRTVLILNLRQK